VRVQPDLREHRVVAPTDATRRATTPSVRYPTVDVLRGLALFSMVTAHVTRFENTTLLGRVVHSPRWIDGAFFFVALSGFVTGLVHRRLVERRGVYASAVKLVRRAGFLYLIHVALVLLAIAVYSSDRAATVPDTPTWAQAGGVWSAIGRVLSLRLEPDFNAVLPMYVVFLLWTVVAVALLRRGAWWTVAGFSLVVYAVGHLTNGAPLAPGGFQLAGWQLLFTAGLLMGWSWEHERTLLTPRRRRRVVLASTAGAVVLYLAARGVPGETQTLVGWGLGKANGGWLAFVFAGMVLIAGYALIERARAIPGAARAVRPVEIMGTKGLPGYVAMIMAVLVLDLLPGVPRTGVTAVLVATVCGLAELAAVRFAHRRRAAVSRSRGGRRGGLYRRRPGTPPATAAA
jgi:hypothetical protein